MRKCKADKPFTCGRKAKAQSTLMRFLKNAFSLSSKTYRSIRVRATAFSTVHTKTFETIE